eukprot:scaffold36955_cov69-Phaeocystis_antarctica.AAC.7
MPAIAPTESSSPDSTETADESSRSLEPGCCRGDGAAGRTVSIVLVAALTVGAASTVTPRAVDNARTSTTSVVSLAVAATAVDVESVTVATTLTLPAVTAMATWHSGALQPR